jgi:hypothetical protein
VLLFRKSTEKACFKPRHVMVEIVQCNLDLVTLTSVTTWDLVTIFPPGLFNLLYKIIRFSDIMQFSDNFRGDQKCH